MPNDENLITTLVFLPVPTLVGGILAGFIWSYGCLRFAGYLRCRRRLPVGYTRKLFHLAVFCTVAGVHHVWGLPGVCLYGVATSVMLAYAVAQGRGYPLYEAIARESDSPHRTYYVVVPYLATLIGGAVSNVLFGPFALVGYMVGGIGDAAGEPVGTKWGRHRFRIPWLGRFGGTKSIEGSAAILVASFAALAVVMWKNSQFHFGWHNAAAGFLIAAICTVIEATSPRGWDNTPMQVVPAYLAFLLFKP